MSAHVAAAVLPPPQVAVFARGPFQAGGVVILDDDEVHHLKVRRVADAATIRLLDGRGGVATARVTVEKDRATARIVATTTVAQPPATELIVGSGDRDRFLDLVEKATELGATRIVPVVTERVQGVATRFAAGHVDKALKRAREALKQCGAAWAPAVVAPVVLADALKGPAPRGMSRFIADSEGEPLPALRERDGVQWAIGPEGGFTEAERVVLAGAGFRPVALGRSTLRYETAALAALAVTAQSRLG
ncbi:MAG: hypothetical protein A2085_00655 [Gemmatimonadetes bacterium GWC2_71_10]|nr:MAG: hypothetical protein A2085_00655 [Gemmatimonadetes bacterium GWC2_71_10]